MHSIQVEPKDMAMVEHPNSVFFFRRARLWHRSGQNHAESANHLSYWGILQCFTYGNKYYMRLTWGGETWYLSHMNQAPSSPESQWEAVLKIVKHGTPRATFIVRGKNSHDFWTFETARSVVTRLD
jgi:hypothetical protein